MEFACTYTRFLCVVRHQIHGNQSPQRSAIAMNNNHLTKQDHYDDRSSLIQKIVQGSNERSNKVPSLGNAIPKRIVQFWDDHARLPDDVNACINTWRDVESQGI